MMTVLEALLLLLAAPALLACGYLILVTLMPARRVAAAPDRSQRFDVIVPAHNEAACIERTVASLLAIDWPRENFRVMVVADNCSDNTAALARAAGARVEERFSDTEKGKGYALSHMYALSAREGFAPAVVVVDADTEVSPNLLAAFAARLHAGANAVQARYGVLNPDASWRTRLMTLALTLFNILRRRGRDALGVSAGLAGNGMCFTHKLLAAVPHQAFSIAEDLEYAIHLAFAGHRVWFANEATVYGEMVSGEEASRSQRRRWEGGRLEMTRLHMGPLFAKALRERSGLALDTALDLFTPPLAYLALYLVAGGVLMGGLAFFTGIGSWSAAAFGFCLALLAAHILLGIPPSGLGWRGLLDLARAPGYLLWKLANARPNEASGNWIRTEREASKPHKP